MSATETGRMDFAPDILRRAMVGEPGVLAETVTFANGDVKPLADITPADIDVMDAWMKKLAADEMFAALEYERVLRQAVEMEAS